MNTDSLLVSRADQFAAKAHASVGQLRSNNEPYIIHPRAVAAILFELGFDDVSIAAALLHDTVEDTPVTFAEIEDSFGKEVAILVQWLTKDDDPTIGNRQARCAHECERIRHAPYMAKCIKLADITHNVTDIVQSSPGFAKKYVPEKKAMLDVLRDADPRLIRMAEKAIERAETELALTSWPNQKNGMHL